MEGRLETLYEEERVGYLSKATKLEATLLEQRRMKILDEKEKVWRIKSITLCLEVGDENTKFFH